LVTIRARNGSDDPRDTWINETSASTERGSHEARYHCRRSPDRRCIRRFVPVLFSVHGHRPASDSKSYAITVRRCASVAETP
jgi:hypothetical protein